MIVAALAFFTSSVSCALVGPAVPVASDTAVNREALYRHGIPFEQFLDQAVRRRQMWLKNHAKGSVPEDLLQRARAVPGTWYLLVVAEDACSDSANTLPYVAHLVSAVEGLDMRIVSSKVGRVVMEDHRTPDGRAATPTMVLLNSGFNEVGCFIERPRELQDWALEHRDELDDDEFLEQKFAWYDRDLGRQTLSEIVSLMEAAASGSPGC